MDPWLLLLLTVVSYGTATVSGVLGMAGGMMLLGIMAGVLPPLAIVPIHGIVQLASNGSRTLVFLRQVSWRLALVYCPPLTIGAIAATAVWSGTKAEWLKPTIGCFILLFLLWRKFVPALRALPLWTYAVLGLVVGFLTIFVGATGPLIAPFFFREDISKEQIIATKAICQMWGHLLKIPAFLLLGFDYGDWTVPLLLMIGASIAGTLTGKGLLENMDRLWFDRLFTGLLVVLAVWLVVG